MIYSADNWYWLAADERLFSSAVGKLIPLDDAHYLAWVDGGNAPTPWPSDDDGEQTNAALDQVLAPYGRQTGLDIERLKMTLKGQIDSAAETERLKYITPGHGQAMTYQQKVAEAQAFKVATNPQPADYPILSSEVGITAETLEEVVNVVLVAFAQWQQIGALIESIRLGAKRDIDAAEDEATARAIVDALVWPSGQVQP